MPVLKFGATLPNAVEYVEKALPVPSKKSVPTMTYAEETALHLAETRRFLEAYDKRQSKGKESATPTPAPSLHRYASGRFG